MNTRSDYFQLIIQGEMEAYKLFKADPNKILSLFISQDHVIELVRIRGVLPFKIIQEGHASLQKLFTTPQQVYNLYAANKDLTEIFIDLSADYFYMVFQNFDDMVNLALLNPSLALSIFPASQASQELSERYKNTTVCDSLFQLAAKDCIHNLCLLLLRLIPMSNIKQQDFDKLYLLMTNNPSIKRNEIEQWKNKYYYENSSLLSSFNLFVGNVVESASATTQAISEYVFGYNSSSTR